MRWRAIRAIIRRDLGVARTNRAVMAPLVVLPTVFVVILPVFASLIARVEVPRENLDVLLRIVPAGVLDQLPGDSGSQLASALLGYLLPPLTLVVPVVVVMVLATDAVAGERERGTLEGLLLAPMSDRDLLVAKLAGPFLAALAVGLTEAIVYATVVNATMWPVVGGPLLPNRTWLLLVCWLGPALCAAGLALAVLVSALSRTVQGAQQIAGIAVLPLIFMIAGQFSGLLFLGPWLLLAVGACLWALCAALALLGARALRRDRIGPRLR